MVRIITGIAVGFIVWTILWLGSDQVLMNLSADWYGPHQRAFETAMLNETPFTPDSTILLMHLVRTVIVSIMAGFIAVVVAGENVKVPAILGVLLLLCGVIVEAMAWSYLPIWYHIIFLALLVPMTVLGGRLRGRT
jgi:hypothetical protein